MNPGTPRKHFDVIILGGGIAGIHLAAWCIAGGLTVGVIDIGPIAAGLQKEPRPRLICTGRRHHGSSAARNHVVGGNGHYWGGVMARNRTGELAGLVDARGESASSLEESYEAVEDLYRLPHTQIRKSAGFMGLDDGWRLAEVVALMGRRRNVSTTLLGRLAGSAAFRLFPRSEVFGIDRQGQRIRAIIVQTHGEGSLELSASRFVVAMGTIDSNLFCLRHVDALGVERGELLGRCLHDHWSLPLFDVRADSTARFGKDLAPRFYAGLAVARRLETQRPSGGWCPAAFLHFQCHFDDISPYRQIKSLLDLRQRGARAGEYLAALAGLVPEILPLGRIGWDRLVHGRLHLSRAVPIVATLDFESCPVPANRISIRKQDPEGETALLEWDFPEADAHAFAELYAQSDAAMQALASRYSLSFSPAGGLAAAADPSAYAKEHARDAYHLGGGVPAGMDAQSSIIRPDLRFHSTDNLFMLSAAAFRRPGIANPTLSLLALAHGLSREIIRNPR